jgi:hypothetical protein
VVVWNEASVKVANQWVVMAKAFNPALGWDPTPSYISDVLEPRDDRWLAEPVMDPGGTFVAAWTAVTAADPNKDANYSNTRTSAGVWGTPVQISKDYPAHNLERPKLAVGNNGTLVGAWVVNETGSMTKSTALYANARDPGNPWGSEQRVSPQEDNLTLYGLEIWPDGTAVALWKTSDLSRSSTQDEGLFWSARHAGSWGVGGGGEGQLGSWVDELNGAALKLGNDGSATALWGVKDANKPSGKQGVVIAASWPPGGPWSTEDILGSDYDQVFTWHEGLALGPGEQSVGATWLVLQSSAPAQLAVYYASTESGNTAPNASFSVQPASGPTSTNFQFDASASSDNEDISSALEVRWDWEDDSTFDTTWSTTKTVSHQYQTPNTYQVRLQVRDTGGLIDSLTKQVTVTGIDISGDKYLFLPMTIR